MLPLTNVLPAVTKAVENNTKTLHTIYTDLCAVNDEAKIVLDSLDTLQVHLISPTRQRLHILSERIGKLRSLIRRSDHITDNQKYQLEKDTSVVATNVLQTSAKLESLTKLIQNSAAPLHTSHTHQPNPVCTLASLTEKSRTLVFAITGLYIEMHKDAERVLNDSTQLLVTKASDFKKRVQSSTRLLLSLNNFCAKSLEVTKEVKHIFGTFQATIQTMLERSQKVVDQDPTAEETANDFFIEATQESSIALPCYESLQAYVQTFQAAHKELACASLLQEVTSEYERQKSMQDKQKELEDEETAERMQQFVASQDQYNADAAAFRHKAAQLRARGWLSNLLGL